MTYQYWHKFDFPEFKTEGIDNSPEKLKFCKFPDMNGKTVLDIGAWDGYFSFVAEKMGARKVTAFDSRLHAWNETAHEVEGKLIIQKGKEGFDTAKKALNSNVRYVTGELADLEDFITDPDGFDIVLCLGILYHCKDPYKLIRDLGRITKETLVLETHTDANYLIQPAMIFYPGKELNNDSGNWWGPNLPCIADMLRTAGFNDIKLVGFNGRACFHASKC